MRRKTDLKLSWKLAAIGLAFVLPLAILLYLAVSNINGQIQFSQYEVYGNAYQRPLEALLEHLPAFLDDPAAAEPRIDQAFRNLQAAQDQYGEALQFTDEGLRIRGRSHLKLPTVLAKWQSLKTADPAKRPEIALSLIDDVMNMIAHAGDTSNLILDPDLDSYYMMDLTLLALPATQRRLTDIADFGRAALATGRLTETDRRRFNSYAEILQDSDYNRILGSTSTSLNEDPNFYGVSPDLKKHVEPALAKYQAATEALIAMLHQVADQDPPTVSPRQFALAAQDARAAAFRYWDVDVKELDTFLGVRIDDYKQKRLTMLLATGLAMLLATFLAWRIGRGINRTILAMGRFANQVAQGDMAAKPGYTGSTRELTELGRDIQAMVDTLKEKLGFAQGILAGMATPCVVADPKGDVTFLNPQLGRLLGKGEDTARHLGQPLAGLFARDPDLARPILAAIRDHQHQNLPTHQGQNEAGQTYTLRLSASPIYDLDQHPLGAFAQFADLTDLKRQEAEVLERNRVIAETAQRASAIAELVTAAAEELSSIVEQTSRGAGAQKERTREAVSAMEQMNVSVLDVARNASNAAEQADKTMNKAREGADTVNHSVTAIGRVKDHTDDLKQRIGIVSEQAAGIDRIMNVISDIADQTNLLALNAAIEAARAGDAGRGFAVVADEVRKLAEKTMQATKEVGSAISGIQADSEKAVSGMDEAAAAVDDATTLAQNSGKALDEILDLARTTSDQVRSIAAAAEEQSAASEEISRSVGEVNNVADETATGMERSVDSVSRLTAQADQLHTLIADMTAKS
ncbi:MAG: methyl-accepting chemotaxis protein [Desulfovibrionaceae bacterium]